MTAGRVNRKGEGAPGYDGGMEQPLPFLGRDGLLSHRVADELAQRILGGELREGARLPSEPDLSVQFGVSRSVVRDAIRTLAARGLVDVRQGFGTVVRAPSDERAEEAIFELLVRSELTMRDVWLAREALDVDLAARAASARTDDDVGELRGLCAAMAAAEGAADWDGVEAEHLRWHLHVVDAVHVPALHTILLPMQRIVLATGLPASNEPPWGVAVHAAVVDAIEARDEAAARAAMLEHYAFIHDPAYAEVGSIPFREVPRAQERLRPRRG